MALLYRPLYLAGLVSVTACAGSTSSSGGGSPAPSRSMSTAAPNPDPRVGLKAGRYDAAQALWNMRLLSTTPPTEKFVGSSNSDLAFLGNYVIQGNYNGWQIWDIGNPSRPTLKTAYYCPASQSDVSVYKNLLFVSGEGLTGRLDCGGQGVKEVTSKDRLRGLRIFDITDIANPRNVGNVQTCRGSHTHTVLVDPKDTENVYVYISGSAGIRPESELGGCDANLAANDPNSVLFRIEAIKVPLAHPEQAAIVSSPRIFNDLKESARHGEAAADIKPLLDSIVRARGGSGTPTAADTAALKAARGYLFSRESGEHTGQPGPTQCHDITVFPEIGLAGGACGGYGLLLDIKDPVNPKRIGAVADSNFSYWHSATFNNDGTKILFTDEWGGGGQPKCRITDPKEWGANAIFTVADAKMTFVTYYKLPAPQTPQENCVAHNGSLVPIPGRDIMIQGWYQGGLSLFDWTDPAHPKEIGFFDRGPVDSTRMAGGGSWSVYWYNGLIVSSEISRGLDVLELAPSGFISQNEIDAAKTVKFDYLNVQGQQRYVWPPSFALARAYLDQLERSKGLGGNTISATRQTLSRAESASGAARRDALTALATQLDADASGSSDGAKVRKLAGAVRDLAGT